MTSGKSKNILFILTGGTISAEPSLMGLIAANISPVLAPILAASPLDFDYELQQLFAIDSTNMQPENWVTIAAAIQTQYDDYAAFIILHGTDTMAYGAAALSYLIPDSPKPIIFTGSQTPLSQAGSDGITNILDSVAYALSDYSHATSIVFQGEVILGTRARKIRTRTNQAFATVDFTNRAYVRSQQTWPILAPPTAPVPTTPVPAYHQLDPRVALVHVIPGMSGQQLELMAQTAAVIIIAGFGIGGLPENPELGWRASINRLVEAGKRIILTTQVPLEGCDFNVYAVGAMIVKHPRLFQAENMTIEALVMKAMWALAEAPTDDYLFKSLMHRRIDYDVFEKEVN